MLFPLRLLLLRCRKDNEFELIKMAVTPKHRGKQYGDMLLEKCIAKAKEMKASKLILFSNSNLQTAIRLYEKFGFKHTEVIDAPSETANIKMELYLYYCHRQTRESRYI